MKLASDPCSADTVGPRPFAGDAADFPAVALWRSKERERLRSARQRLSVAERSVIDAELTRHLDAALQDRLAQPGVVLSGYWPIKGEPDLRPWFAKLHEAGVAVAMPVVHQRAVPLVFRLWHPALAMERGHWNIPVPPDFAEQVMPDITLAPLVGWDMDRYRLGYGGGYFDRTLGAADPRPFAVGVGFQAARLPTIHPQPHDIPMNLIVTEAGVQC